MSIWLDFGLIVLLKLYAVLKSHLTSCISYDLISVDGIGALHALQGEAVDEESDLESEAEKEKDIEEEGPLALKHMKEKEKAKLEAKRNPWEVSM